ncbi:MAG: YdcF family protein, partial [Acidimicrobiales bacterium]
SAAYLSSRGVPDSAILREVSGRSSWQQLAAAANFLKQRDISRVLLVSDGFHSARIAAMADELGLTGFTSPTTSSPIKGLSVIPYLGKETVAVAAGRVVGFRRMAGIDRTVGRARAQAQAAPASLNNRHSGVV